MHLRVEMLMLGLQGVVESLRDSSSTMLNDHLDFFEMSRQDDELHFVRYYQLPLIEHCFYYVLEMVCQSSF